MVPRIERAVRVLVLVFGLVTIVHIVTTRSYCLELEHKDTRMLLVPESGAMRAPVIGERAVARDRAEEASGAFGP